MTPEEKLRYDFRRKIMDAEWKTGLEPREAAIEVLVDARNQTLEEAAFHIENSTFMDEFHITETVKTCLAMIRNLKRA